MTADQISGLLSLGFTEYEARVYIALLGQHPANGYQISKTSGVPRSMVYEALGRLDLRGAVLKSEERRATLYTPLPPDQLLSQMERSVKQRVDDLRSSLTSLYLTQREDLFWSLNGRSAVLGYAAQMLAEASHEAWLVLADPELEALRPLIVAASERGLAIHALLTGSGDLPVGRIARHPQAESAAQQIGDMLEVVVDQKKCLISSSSPTQEAAGEMTATVTTNYHMTLIAHQFIWMELFTQILTQELGPDYVEQLANKI